MHDPNSSRMFASTLGTTDKGCQCQSKWLVLWNQEGKEIVLNELLSNSPEILVSASCRLRTDDEIKIKGKSYQRTYCDWFSDNFWNSSFDLEDELKNKPSGYYVVMAEFACFASYNWEYGDEGDGEWVFVVLNNEPIPESEIDNVDITIYKAEGEDDTKW